MVTEMSMGKNNKGGGFVWEHKGRLLQLYGNEIYYLHSQQRKLFVHTAKNVYEIGGKLDEEEEHLKRLPMVRTHYSYLVHLRYLEQISGREATLKNGERIPVSERRRKQVYEKICECAMSEHAK